MVFMKGGEVDMENPYMMIAKQYQYKVYECLTIVGKAIVDQLIKEKCLKVEQGLIKLVQ